jgi:preprotein translocase subunit SecY
VITQLFESQSTGSLDTGIFIGVLAAIVGLTLIIVYVERAQRRITIQYPKRQVGNKMFGGDVSHMPLKINTSGVIPAIFASALLGFPLTLAGFSAGSSSGILQWINLNLGHGKPLFTLIYGVLIIFFSFFYTAVIFNPTETATNLKKNNGFIPGIRPGENTAKYLDYVLTRLTVIGALYLTLICVVPEIFYGQFQLNFYIGGTSLLIVVNVIMDTITQIQTHLISYQYGGLIRKAQGRRGRR